MDTVRWRWRKKFAIALVFVRLVSSMTWTPPTPKMQQTLISCHETCFACKSANSEWRAGDVSDNANCKLCNECYEQNKETIVNDRRNIDVQGSTLEGHFDKFIMISNEETVYPEGCPRPPACPEDYPWALIKNCPPLKPCDRPRRALEKPMPSEDPSYTSEKIVVLAKSFSPISRPTVAWPTTTSAPTDTLAPGSIPNFMKKSMLRQATSNILPEGDIFLLKQVAKTESTQGRNNKISQISMPKLKSEHKKNAATGKKPQRPKSIGRSGDRPKSIERSGDTTPCLNDTIDPNFFADHNYDDELNNKDQGHAFRPNEFHDVMQTMPYKPLNETENSDENSVPKEAKVPQPQVVDVLPMEPTQETNVKSTTEASTEETTTVDKVTEPMQTTVKKVPPTAKAKDIQPQHHYVDYVTFPLNYEDSTPLNVPNCCPSCICSMPMCMIGGCGYGALQNNYNYPTPSYPQYLEVDDNFAKANLPTQPNTHSTVMVSSDRKRNIVYLGFPNI